MCGRAIVGNYIFRGEHGFCIDSLLALLHSPLTVSPRRGRDQLVIKFRCLNCGQKLACAEDGIGAVVSCTNCGDQIVVPPYSITETYPTGSAHRHGVVVSNRPVSLGPVIAPAGDPKSALRGALIPHLARMMMNRLVQALFAQRESLLNTQSDAAKRMAELEERIARAQLTVQERFAAYENRIAELEKQLLANEEEKRELMRQNFQLARKALEAENAAAASVAENVRAHGATRVDLSNAGFLLRA